MGNETNWWLLLILHLSKWSCPMWPSIRKSELKTVILVLFQWGPENNHQFVLSPETNNYFRTRNMERNWGASFSFIIGIYYGKQQDNECPKRLSIESTPCCIPEFLLLQVHKWTVHSWQLCCAKNLYQAGSQTPKSVLLKPPQLVLRAYQLPPIQCCFIAICICI